MKALAAIGPRAASAADVLKRAGADPDYVVRYAAAEALKRVSK